MLASRVFSLFLLAVWLGAARADMEVDDINDDSYTRKQGLGGECPERIRFRRESLTLRTQDIRINEDVDCPVTNVEIRLQRITSLPANPSSAVRYFSDRRSDVGTFLAGPSTGAFTCTGFRFPAVEWIFLEPDDDVEDVVWSDVYGSPPRFVTATDSRTEVELDDDERYLLIGDRCFYEDSSLADSVCFPAEATVELEDGSVKAMDNISIGDRVHVGNGKYSEVFGWTHHTTDKRFKFVRLTTKDGQELVATGSHYVYASDKVMPMRKVRVGMSLRLADGKNTVVVKKDRVVRRGLYNPQTLHGDIVVNGIVATTYTQAVEPTTAHALLAPLRAAFQAVKGVLPQWQSAEL